MFKFYKKNKLVSDIAMAVVAALASSLYWYEYYTGVSKWKFFGGLIFGLSAVMKFVDVFAGLKKRKQLNAEKG